MNKMTKSAGKSGGPNGRPSDFPIDIVIPWVDGNDPEHKAKRLKFRTKSHESEDVGGDCRFDSLGEIFYCVQSINIFAKFIRKIFIVTDGQDPHLEEPMSGLFPDGHIPMEIIDHREIFRGYEDYLPTFNSRSIETLIWRIPDLSEHFILMNDDFIITGRITPEDFFRGEKTVCYAKSYPTLLARLIRLFRSDNRISFKDSMLNAVDIMGGCSRFMYLGHTPRALRKSFYEEFYRHREDLIIRNIRHKFRNCEQFNSQELFYISEYKKGRCLMIPTDDRLLYLKPKHEGDYIARKLKSFDNKPDAPFCCINTLCLASKKDQEMVMDWVRLKLSAVTVEES